MFTARSNEQAATFPIAMCLELLKMAYNRWYKAGIQLNNRRNVAKLCIADALGNGEFSDGYAGKQVKLEKLEVVCGKPREDQDEVLHCLLDRQLLILELLEQVVGEEGLLCMGQEGGGQDKTHLVGRISRVAYD